MADVIDEDHVDPEAMRLVLRLVRVHVAALADEFELCDHCLSASLIACIAGGLWEANPTPDHKAALLGIIQAVTSDAAVALTPLH